MTHKIETQLEAIQAFISQQRLSQKEILTLAEAAAYTGLSKSFLYKKTSKREVTFYKLEQKLIYFKKTDLDQYLLSNRQAPVSEIADSLFNSKNTKVS
ncbi:MAG: helix-turn-helix domain-containing protein [Bacteroidetes bacterium]|nr:helix-turn-helix domain-containing protein [Bacteroidota bacterium]